MCGGQPTLFNLTSCKSVLYYNFKVQRNQPFLQEMEVCYDTSKTVVQSRKTVSYKSKAVLLQFDTAFFTSQNDK